MTATVNSKYFNSLQIYRGFAAMMVVIHHQWNSFSHFLKYDSVILDFVAAVGKYGVDFFFVLSGFIITYSNFKYSENPPGIRRYSINRLLRVYIPYLPIGLLMLGGYYFFESLSMGSRDVSWFTSITLIPIGPPALSVAWTLIHELLFYLIFAVWFFNKKLFNWFLFFWVILILDANYFEVLLGGLPNSYGLSFLFSLYNLEFVLGYLSAVFFIQSRSAVNKNLIFVCVSIFLTFLFLKWFNFHLFQHDLNLLFSISCLTAILFSIQVDFGRNSKLLLIVGNASYSIYLVHNPIISFCSRVFPVSPYITIQTSFFILGFIICLLFGIIYSKLFESILMNLLKERFLKVGKGRDQSRENLSTL